MRTTDNFNMENLSLISRLIDELNLLKEIINILDGNGNSNLKIIDTNHPDNVNHFIFFYTSKEKEHYNKFGLSAWQNKEFIKNTVMLKYTKGDDVKSLMEFSNNCYEFIEVDEQTFFEHHKLYIKN